MPIGAGITGAGTSLVGFGTSDLAPVPQQLILIDAVDGSFKDARKIDPSKGQYVFDSKGRIQGMDRVQQMVLMRAATVRNSSAVIGLGLAPPSGVIGVNIVRKLEEQIRQAMKDLIDAKTIEVVEVLAERVTGSNAFRRFFKWRDLTKATLNSPGTEQITQF